MQTAAGVKFKTTQKIFVIPLLRVIAVVVFMFVL
jgi:hypothetical protein